jgi:hypothetical protein
MRALMTSTKKFTQAMLLLSLTDGTDLLQQALDMTFTSLM